MLANFPVVRLHLAAQRVVFSTLGSATASLGMLWTNWVGLIENINLLGLSIGGETIVGTGVLAGVVGLRWSVAKWEKAKRSFWADWERVGNGLARDLTVRFLFSVRRLGCSLLTSCTTCLQATLDEKFDRHVASVPMAACEQLESLGKKRREELAELEGQVDTLLRDSKNLYSG
jgi:hypothetical protein